ncbi:hypothetical protein V1477_000166 [Vespula maculifrons]|uniref:Secreted protein n=1 Tax=Vespula maculifrons TaxID=7453 RepID=A0ABD2D3S0_VESMC
MVYETILFFTFVFNVTQGYFEKREIGTRVFSRAEEKNRILLCPVKLLSVAVKKDRKQENIVRTNSTKKFSRR